MRPTLFRDHAALPIPLRIWVVVPATVALVGIGGLAFTLPPGPLCDEGMVLFMEGGCDWGESNVFFFSKLGLLVALNIIFAVAWQRKVRRVTGFTPHLLVLTYLVVTERSGGRCDTYYSHPNGSIGQMVLECIGFALLGMSLVAAAEQRTGLRLIATLVAWNAFHVAVFYSGLLFTAHWTWTHSFFVFAVLAIVAATIARR
jgi:hypothetical protein